MELAFIAIEKPAEMNFILGQSHFIKTVEDIQEALVNVNPDLKYGLAFSEASGPCLIRTAGTEPELVKLAADNLERIRAGHSFILFLEDAFPINVLPALRQVPEICRIYCATANPTQVVVAQHEQGNGIMGVVDGFAPKGIEAEEDKQKRHDFLRLIGYKF